MLRNIRKALKNSPPLQRIVLKDGEALPAPHPYASWMEYAAATASTRMIHLDAIDGTYPVDVDRDELRRAIKDEYYALCKAAGIEVNEDSHTRIEKHSC